MRPLGRARDTPPCADGDAVNMPAPGLRALRHPTAAFETEIRRLTSRIKALEDDVRDTQSYRNSESKTQEG